MAVDRDLFWIKVDETKPDKLAGFSPQKLREYQNYFLEVQVDPTLPPHELAAASERLTLLRSEFDLRSCRRQRRETQMLAGIGIALAIVGFFVGQCRDRANTHLATPPQPRTNAALPTPSTTPAPQPTSTPVPTVSVTPSATPTPTPIRGEKQLLSTSTPAAKEVAGFYPYWNLSKVNEVDLTNLSTVYYFALDLNRDGNFKKNGRGMSGLKSNNAKLLKEKVLQNGARWGVTILNLSANSIARNIKNPARQQAIINNTIKLMKQGGFTALNIDLEYVGRPHDTLKKRFTTFIQKLTDSVHREIVGSTVSFDASADSVKKPRIFDLKSLGEILDHVIIMGYDFHSIASQVAGPVAPLTGKERYGYDVTISVSDYLSKVPSQKLLLGVPFYGYDWPTQNNEKGSVVVFSPEGPKVSSYARSIETAQKNNSLINFDEESKSVWFSYFDKQHHTCRQVWFENQKSLGLKFDLVNQTKLGGIAIFALGDDSKEAKPLWDQVKLKLKTP